MRSILILMGLLACLTTKAQSTLNLNDEFQKSTVLPKHYYGFSLYDVDEQCFVYNHNQDKHFTPASNTKVFTLFASLKLIGDSIPGIAYVERGDSLIFWGTGDPSFLHPRLDNGRVYNFLKNSNKKLFYSSSPTQEPTYRNGWSIEDYEFYYQPELFPFPIYGNVVQFREVDGKLKLFPSYFERDVKQLADTTTRYRIHRALENNRYEINELPLPKNYVNEKPFRPSDSLLVLLLQDTLKKDVGLVHQQLPQDFKIYNSVEKRVVEREMMLPSDNFLAEQFNMVASFLKYNSFKTEDLRQYMMDTYYSKLSDTIELRDGSGLSSYNKITPRSMVEVLLQISNEVRDENAKHFLFPAGGLEGTLKNVYPTPGGKAFVWAKTGTINSVHCQSGYIITKKGKRYVFSFLNNNFMGSSSPVRKEMVRIVTHIYENF
ncbi:D-alanyl-D-alanine carboxypeptidase [Sphingobacterium mizutaii]|uniref:D-alanyl-D-alanine carboxypeptidase n=1 Tax=Sphingobacterium mizutaii TaxID=1010 RepID=UPI00289E18A4|nr:D-alanyl-D-alanine carboxypeptidase [Sphingobacterium mizutaii]